MSPDLIDLSKIDPWLCTRSALKFKSWASARFAATLNAWVLQD